LARLVWKERKRVGGKHRTIESWEPGTDNGTRRAKETEADEAGG